MALSKYFKHLMNHLSPGAHTVKLGDVLSAHDDAVQPATETTLGTVMQGVTVANAAGSAPTAAEFDALVNSLKNAGVIASS